jgi:hypothetical protein
VTPCHNQEVITLLVKILEVTDTNHKLVILGDKMWVYGGSDGNECFSDVFVLDLEKATWAKRKTSQQMPCFSHSSALGNVVW